MKIVYSIKSLNPGGLLDVRPKVKVRCIDCHQWVVLGEYGPDGKAIALHPLPQCKLFIEHGLLAYIRKLREHYEQGQQQPECTRGD